MAIATMHPSDIPTNQKNSMGAAVPAFTPHAISVSLPTWKDNVGYEEGEERVIKAMVNGYPRFFIHLSIQKLAQVCEQKFGVRDEKCMLFPTARIADECRVFIIARSAQESGTATPVRLVQFLICPEDKSNDTRTSSSTPPSFADAPCVNLHIALFPATAFPIAKQFWQHTGMGISSRLADYALSLLATTQNKTSPALPAQAPHRPPTKCQNRHYSSIKKGVNTPDSAPRTPSAPSTPTAAEAPDALVGEHSTYLEERYGRNLPLAHAPAAKRALRRRIAGTLVQDVAPDIDAPPRAGSENVELGPSSRGVSSVTEDDVFLYPTGMTAIWSAHAIARAVRPAAKSICFGFPYTDTLKILQKWGPGCHFFGHGLDTDIDALDSLLGEEAAASTSPSAAPPALALFTEFPSNPLLRAPDLPRLRALADKYDFLLVVDETLGNFCNVEVLPYADMVVSSLSKVFSGDANVMGGSLILNPAGRHYSALKAHMSAYFEDFYFDEDALYMERNSRDFARRIAIIDANTEAVCDFLRARSAANGAPAAVVKDVFYPKWTSRANYDRCRIQDARGEGGFGGLFAITFSSLAASRAFFDALPCYKGPSLGTNFTLACPYTVIAHYLELEWVATYGVEEGLVRVSVGMEGRQELLDAFSVATRAAEAASRVEDAA